MSKVNDITNITLPVYKRLKAELPDDVNKAIEEGSIEIPPGGTKLYKHTITGSLTIGRAYDTIAYDSTSNKFSNVSGPVSNKTLSSIIIISSDNTPFNDLGNLSRDRVLSIISIQGLPEQNDYNNRPYIFCISGQGGSTSFKIEYRLEEIRVESGLLKHATYAFTSSNITDTVTEL